MKTLNNPQNALFPNKRNLFGLGIISLMLLAWGCRNDTTNSLLNTPPTVIDAYVYGKVDTSILQNTYRNFVYTIRLPYRPSCADYDTATPKHENYGPNFGPIQPSGRYHTIGFDAESWAAGHPPCFKAFVIGFNSSDTNLLHYDSVLASKILPPDFDVHICGVPPYENDTVRVDFTVNDSIK